MDTSQEYVLQQKEGKRYPETGRNESMATYRPMNELLVAFRLSLIARLPSWHIYIYIFLSSNIYF